ncbi:hypothetical protein FQR65_LT04043 [Abscondita terminalis]|nr:hypothetical protein FQR65_LT04043 [Abscondita terminalis]
MFKILLKTFVLFNCAFAEEWLPPYFEKNPEENLNLSVNEGGKTALINLNENVDYNIIIAYYSYSVITKPQDYEKNQTRYSFITTVDIVSITFYVLINNLDDEEPMIELTSSSTPCIITEEYKGLSNCKIQITDLDGYPNNLKYDISSTVVSNVKDIFHIKNEGSVEDGDKTLTAVLEVLQEVYYEKYPSYILQFTVTDSGNRSASVKIIIQVEDIPNTPPRWMQIITSETIPEKEERTFTVSAIDGDTQINADISYKIESEWPNIFKVGKESGIVKIEPINRDELQKELFSFNLIAYETNDETSFTPQSVTIVVEDKDDNKPVITLNTTNAKIDESRLTTLPINIRISDLDLGPNATYNVLLIDTEFSKAFQIVPNSGYQTATFSISVINSELLDYENTDWREFELTIRSEENINKNMFDEKTITISLKNWNDHEPIFTEIEYTATVSEDVGLDYEIIKVEAKDNDDGDTVTYKLLGAENNRLFTIDENGVIKTNNSQAFDYEKQPMVFIQIQAEDMLGEPYHKTVVQLIINVEDVNDEQPSISVGQDSISVKENADDQAPLNEHTEISAYDADTHSNLKFSIEWSNSYGVKNGQKVKVKEWIQVDTEFDSTNARAIAKLKVVDMIDSGTPDYELFDTMNLQLVVTDLNQTIGKTTAQVQVTILIEDENDNNPEFHPDTTITIRSVIEGSEAKTTIGTIVATDRDGPNHNKVIYSLSSEPGTPSDWIDIELESGILFVTGKEKIDADTDKIYKLNYTVTAFNEDDANRKDEAKITINLIDTNNNTPECIFDQTIHIMEKADNDFELPQTICCTDKDRDESYHTLWYRFASTATDIKNLFFMNESTGRIKVAKQNGFELNRDEGQSIYTIPFVVKDNYNQEGSIVQQSFEASFQLILDDKNDNPPIIETSNIDGKEEMTKGTVLDNVVARDKDEPNTDNSKIKFEILKITKDLNAGDDPPSDLFIIDVDDLTSGIGKFTANYDLRGYYGMYTALIKAYDLGTEPQASEKNVTININKYNFCPPLFINPSPSSNRSIYLKKDQPGLNAQLITTDGNNLDPFEAYDQQNGKWDIAISIDPASNPNGVFKIVDLPKSQGALVLNDWPNTNVQHELTLLADCQCSGSASSITNLNIKVRFMNLDSEPEFVSKSDSLEFPENSTSIITKQLSKAYFNAENEEWDYPSYYFLTVDDSNAFQINNTSAELSLMKALDRENQSNWILTVVASRSALGNSNPEENSILTVYIKVTDVNDNVPNFDKDEFYAGVKPTNALYSVILPLTATDLDIDEKLNITILPETLEASGSGIDNILDPFYIKTETQILENNVIA